jgi:hypothetical protein
MSGSTKKSQAKEILQQADLPGHGTLCERQLFGSLCVALVFCGRFKANQSLGGGDFAAHEGAEKILIYRIFSYLSVKSPFAARGEISVTCLFCFEFQETLQWPTPHFNGKTLFCSTSN